MQPTGTVAAARPWPREPLDLRSRRISDVSSPVVAASDAQSKRARSSQSTTSVELCRSVVATAAAATASLATARSQRQLGQRRGLPTTSPRRTFIGRWRASRRGHAVSCRATTRDALINEVTAPAVLLVLAVLYGGNVPLLKTVELTAPLNLTAPELLSLRFVAASVVVLPWLVLNWKQVRPVLQPACELGFWLVVGYALQILGLEKTSVSTAAVATALTGPFVQALQIVVDKKPFVPFVGACSLGTLGGIALFATAPGGGENPLAPLIERILNFFPLLAQHPRLPHEALLSGVPGEALALGGVFFFAVHVWRSNAVVSEGDKTGELKGDDFEVGLASVQLVVATALCILWSFFDSPFTTSEQFTVLQRLDVNAWGQIAACGVLCTGIPALLELFAFKFVEPAIASLIYCTIPLWGTMLGVFFLHDSFGPQSIAAGLIILSCSFAPSAVELWEKREQASAES